MSTDILVTARMLPSTTATTTTITVSGRRMAKTIGFMGWVLRERKAAMASAVRERPRPLQSGQSARGSKFMMRDVGSAGILGRR